MKPEPLLLSATLLAPEEPAEPEARVRDVMFYSGSPIERYDFWTDEEYLLSFSMDPQDVRLDNLNGGAPVFKDHMPMVDSTIGKTSNARLTSKGAYATLTFSAREDLDGFWQDVQAGIINAVSMGVVIDTLEDITPKRRDAMKHYLARGWEPFEISVVPLGADPKARFLAAQYMSEQHFARKRERQTITTLKQFAEGRRAEFRQALQITQQEPSVRDEARVKLALAINRNQRERNERRTA